MTSHLLKNGRIDKYLFPGGYAQAYYFGNIGHRIKEGLGTADRNVTTNMNMKDDMHSTLNNISTFEPYFYNQDHLGNNREVVDNLIEAQALSLLPCWRSCLLQEMKAPQVRKP